MTDKVFFAVANNDKDNTPTILLGMSNAAIKHMKKDKARNKPKPSKNRKSEKGEAVVVTIVMTFVFFGAISFVTKEIYDKKEEIRCEQEHNTDCVQKFIPKEKTVEK